MTDLGLWEISATYRHFTWPSYRRLRAYPCLLEFDMGTRLHIHREGCTHQLWTEVWTRSYLVLAVAFARCTSTTRPRPRYIGRGGTLAQGASDAVLESGVVNKQLGWQGFALWVVAYLHAETCASNCWNLRPFLPLLPRTYKSETIPRHPRALKTWQVMAAESGWHSDKFHNASNLPAISLSSLWDSLHETIVCIISTKTTSTRKFFIFKFCCLLLYEANIHEIPHIPLNPDNNKKRNRSSTPCQQTFSS